MFESSPLSEWLKRHTMKSSWPHFSRQELQCKCGCGAMRMDPGFMATLEDIRSEYDKPMIVTSAYRCPKHNQAVSSTGPNGPHTTGRAIDIAVHGRDAFELVSLALRYHMTGIGINQKGSHSSRFIHLDNIYSSKRPWIWSY